jgi:hypothetical protein
MTRKGFVDNAVAMRHRNLRDRILAMKHYGGNPPRCSCCGDGHFSFLTVDHIDGNGNEERTRLFGNRYQGGHDMYRYLRKNGFPSGYRVLCMNCQVGKRDNMGHCPHEVPAPTPEEFLGLFDALRVGASDWGGTETEAYKAAWQAIQRKWQDGEKTARARRAARRRSSEVDCQSEIAGEAQHAGVPRATD